jgi:hypothetical protein
LEQADFQRLEGNRNRQFRNEFACESGDFRGLFYCRRTDA